MIRPAGVLSLVRKGAPLRFRYYPINYPPLNEVAAPTPYWMYPVMDEETKAIADKAKGPWHDLTDEDRIRLYRAYFPATFAEMAYPPSYAKEIWGTVLFLSSLVFPLYWLIKTFLLNPAPYQMHPDYQNMLEDRMDALHQSPVWGGAAKYYKDGHLIEQKEGEY